MDFYTLDIPGFGSIECRIAVAVDGSEPVVLENLSISADGRSIRAQAPCGAVAIELDSAFDGSTPAVRISSSIEIDAPHRSINLYPFFNLRLHGATHLLTHGRTMGRCKSCPLPAESFSFEAGEVASSAFESFFQTVVTFGGHGHIHVTQPLKQDDLSKIEGSISGDTVLLSAATRIEYPGPGLCKIVPTVIAFVADAFKAMCDYGDSQKEADLPTDPQPAGWNSWDSYRWTITEEEVMRNAEFIASDQVLSQHVRRIIVDDGWQYCYGEWEANPLFPSGMEALARNLRRMGFTPGLWIAPYAVEPHARIAQLDADMLALSEGGDPCLSFECMRRKGFILDPTVEKSREFLRKTFDRYASCGYGYFKADFLGSLFSAPRFHDSSVPRSRLAREALAPILEGIGGRAALLGCNFLFDCGNSAVKLARVGSDIHATWECAKVNAVSVAARAWASNRLWVTDPDFCLCRGPETAEKSTLGRLQCLGVFVKPDETSRFAWGETPWSFGFDTIKFEEAKCLLSVAIMNGGAINLSDKLYDLNNRGLDLVRRTVSATHGSAPTPLDLFESAIASKWVQRIPGGLRILLVNWEDEERELALELEAYGISAKTGRDFWSDGPVPTQGGRLVASLKPHSCLLAEFLLR